MSRRISFPTFNKKPPKKIVIFSLLVLFCLPSFEMNYFIVFSSNEFLDENLTDRFDGKFMTFLFPFFVPEKNRNLLNSQRFGSKKVNAFFPITVFFVCLFTRVLKINL